MEEFLYRYRNPSETVHTKLNTESQKKVKDNQKVIESLLKVIMVCGKQGIGLCGHSDDRIVWNEHEDFRKSW